MQTQALQGDKMKMGSGRNKGFSLIELLIVVAIILIIAAIAIPNMLKSRQAANQASAVGSLRTINTAEVTYASTYNTGYSRSLDLLGPGPVPGPSAAGLIDNVLASGSKSAYTFHYVSCPSPPGPDAGAMSNGSCTIVISYQVVGNPNGGIGYGVFYYTDASGVIRQNSSTNASPSDSPLAG